MNEQTAKRIADDVLEELDRVSPHTADMLRQIRSEQGVRARALGLHADMAISMSDREHALARKLGSLANDFNDIMTRGIAYDEDYREVVYHIHALQNMVMAQAAARMYPNMYRPLGGSEAKS